MQLAAIGREHQPRTFYAWMAAGRVKPGFSYDETDEMGIKVIKVIEGKIYIHYLHATMLDLLKIDRTQLTRRHFGHDFRLTDVYGSVVKEIPV